MKKVSISNVIASDMCSGCGICVDNACDMKYDENGFLRPKIEKVDVSRIAYCPGNDVSGNFGETGKKHFIWGSVVEAYSGYATNNLRNIGSSGGALTRICQYLLDNNLVDEVIVTGASKDNPLVASSSFVNASEKLNLFAGSRYQPSSPLSILKNISFKKKYAFIGKPCDVYALRKFIDQNEKYSKSIPYLFSFFCAGVPSQNATTDILKEFGVEASEVKKLKYRGEGWPGYTQVTTVNDDIHRMSYSESWGGILNKKLQKRCKFCVDGIGEYADIVCADVWDVDQGGKPDFSEKDGKSLILVRSNKGKNIILQCQKADYLQVQNYDISLLAKVQPYQVWRRATHLVRLIPMIMAKKFVTSYEYSKILKVAFSIGFKENIGALLGTIKRIASRRV